MIETRIKRTLVALSIPIAVGYGLYGASKFSEAKRLDAGHRQWHLDNAAWYDANCKTDYDSILKGTASEQPKACGELWRTRESYRSWANRAKTDADRALVTAATVPLALWTLFFIGKWIWAGRIRPARSTVAIGTPPMKGATPTVATGNRLCLLAAFAINTLDAGSYLPAGHPTYLVISEALGATLFAGVPAFGAQLWLKQKRLYHVMTIVLSLLAVFGNYYGRNH